MDESRVLARLDRIDALAGPNRQGRSAAPGELLVELRGLLREAEELSRATAAETSRTGEVVGRRRTAQLGT